MNSKYKNIKTQISSIAIYRLLTLFLNYALVSLLINYLGKESFGIYVALTSLFSWMFLFDLGIAKGMRNYVTIALANDDILGVRQYISTAYISILLVTVVSCIAVIYLLSSLDLHQFFNIKMDSNLLKKIMIILITGFFVKFYFSTVDQLYYSMHQSQGVTLNGFVAALLNSIGIFILWKNEYVSSVLYTVYVFSISISLPYIFSTFSFFKKNRQLIPKPSFFSKLALNKIFNKGSKILFIQIGFLLIIGVDRLILLKFGSAIEVARYEIIYKVMSIIIFPISIFMAPLWSSFTEAYNRSDIVWIKGIFKKFYLTMIVLFFIVIILSALFNEITYLWLNNFTKIEFYVTFTMGILILELIWSNFHTDFLLGIHKLLFIIAIVLIGLFLKFIFLYYCFLKNDNLNLMNLVTSSIIAYSIYNILSPFYIKSVISKRLKNA